MRVVYETQLTSSKFYSWMRVRVRTGRSSVFNFSITRLRRIVIKALSMHANKIQLTQELNPPDHFNSQTFADWMHEQI